MQLRTPRPLSPPTPAPPVPKPPSPKIPARLRVTDARHDSSHSPALISPHRAAPCGAHTAPPHPTRRVPRPTAAERGGGGGGCGKAGRGCQNRSIHQLLPHLPTPARPQILCRKWGGAGRGERGGSGSPRASGAESAGGAAGLLPRRGRPEATGKGAEGVAGVAGSHASPHLSPFPPLRIRRANGTPADPPGSGGRAGPCTLPHRGCGDRLFP